MKAFLALLNVSFKNLILTTGNVGGRKKRKAATGMGSLVLISLVMLYISAMYSFMLGSTLGPLGGLDVMLMAMTLMATLFPLVFTIFAAQSLVFSTKDLDLVLSLPVSAFSVMLARLMALYLEILLMVELLLIPAGVVWLMQGGGGGIGFLLLLVVTGIFLAFVPTLIALIFGGLISLLISRFQRFKNLFTTLFSLLVLAGVMVLVLNFNASFGSGAELLTGDIEGFRAAIGGAFPPVQWLVQALTGPSPLVLLAIFACCLLPFLFITWLFSLSYKKLLTMLASHKLKSDYKLGAVKGGSSGGALFRKEAKKFFGTPAYLLNAGISYFLLIAASVVAVIFKGTIGEFLGEIASVGAEGQMILSYLPPILLLVLLFFAGLTFISCVSISLEGKTLWILKEAPIGTGRIFFAKAGFNFLLSGITIVVCVPLVTYAFNLWLADMAAMLVLGLLFSLLVSTAGLFINLLLPRMDAENDTIVIKQSASVIVTMLFSFVMVGGLVALFFALQGLGFALFSVIAGAILAVLCLLAILLLNTKGRKLFAAL
ncbi:MAG: hypothetical protein GXY32_05325 [Ruminococcaceae bacterium]|nr:hypothetical protein [Oscillospiraceae bacterium]